MFVHLAVRDLGRSVRFFQALGFAFDPRFSDAQAACMIVGADACVMLLTEAFFRTFTRKEPCDTRVHVEGLFAISCTSRAEVDALVGRALRAGGRRAMEALDRGFLYGGSFYDLDDHQWEVVWLDPTRLAR